MKKYSFTSESVSEGHPDKIADQISDSVLDAYLEQDKKARVACETLVTTGLVLVAGEITSTAKVDTTEVIRSIIEKIGYTKAEYKFDAESCGIISAIHAQSPDINRGVDLVVRKGSDDIYDSIGAGDQGMMFGYACHETPELMPAALMFAHRIVKQLADIRKQGEIMTYLRPDAKSQVTLDYEDNRVTGVNTVVVSTQHDPEPNGMSEVHWQEKIKSDIITNVIKKVIPTHLLHSETKFYINPTGRFEIGGPHGDAGLTGRKIIVDTYGGAAPHGGGAFSGKDPSKVDRSAAYAARHIAKNIVAAQLADRCTVQVSYAIGVVKPVSIYINTHATAQMGITDTDLQRTIEKVFDLRPAAIIEQLELTLCNDWKYKDTAAYGHFGRIYTPHYVGLCIDAINNNASNSTIYTYILYFLTSTLAAGSSMFMVRQTIIVTSRRIEYDLKNDIYHHLQGLAIQNLRQLNTGDLMSRATNDLNAVRNYFGPCLMYFFNTSFRLFFSISAMVAISPYLTFYAMLPAPLLAFLVFKIGEKIRDRSFELQEIYSELTIRTQENLAGKRIIKAFVKEEYEEKRFAGINHVYFKKNMQLAKLQAVFFPVISLLLGLSVLFSIWIGGELIIEQKITYGQLTQFMIYIASLSWPIISIGWITNMLQRAVSGQKRINDLFTIQSEVQPDIANTFENSTKTSTKTPFKINPPNLITPVPAISNISIKGEIQFKHVSFAYDTHPSINVLTDISFTIHEGEKIAIIGPVAAGKSTLAELIPRLLEPTRGQILLDGINIKRIPLSLLRKNIAFVPQDYFLFSTSLKNSIAFGANKNVTDEQIEHAAIQSDIYHDIMSFPNKFQTVIGERGITLSGGQKQRIAIARALIRNAPILILDDSLSAVDTHTENNILNQLFTDQNKQTIIFITHRFSVCEKCDKVFVILNGKLAEIDGVGFWGFFECINDTQVSEALFNATAKWLKSKGLTSMRGPVSPSMNDQPGMLFDGYNSPPVFLMTYNPPYYHDICKFHNFEPTQELLTWIIDKESAINALYRLKRISELVKKRENITIRHANLKKFEEEVHHVLDVYNNAWEENWGFVPMTDLEFKDLASSLKKIVDPGLVYFAENNEGKPVGFSISLPDMNYPLKFTNGNPLTLTGIIKFIWYRRKITKIRTIVMGVIKGYRNKGIDSAFISETIDYAIKKGITDCEVGWVLESNVPMNRLANAIGAKIHKRYLIYEKKLDNYPTK
ncbi:hypothetical protein CHS0354_023830 [Potamilus streckersoni]|uniref:S-adenosylmethionine synthase n=1 Tax=Potamilus streckersoni TaxID=2493646 RepID=A0AAE0RYX7_9BIVA|nr:hypothetical protein CHS0354_023830 [Potamilus streckersoni]